MKRRSAVVIAGIVMAPLLTSCITLGGGGNQNTTPPPQPPPATTPVGQPPTETPPPPTAENAATTPPAGSNEKTVAIDGKYYTCAEVIGKKCDDAFTYAFGKWGDHVDSYVNSGRLGPLGNGENSPFSYEQIATLGLAACAYSERGYTSADFVKDAKETHTTALGTELLPFWFQAHRSICTELPFRG
jgi:hypothetical protein